MQNFWYTLHSSKNRFLNLLDSVSHASTLLCNSRGGTKNEKCPVAIADLVLLYNAAQEGLYGPVKHDRSAFELVALYQGTKMGFSNFVKPTSNAFALTCRIFRVIRADAEEGDTYINVGGFLTQGTKSRKKIAANEN
jgi:hypothetical protein